MIQARSIPRMFFLIISFLFMWGIFTGNYDNGDYIFYEMDFAAGLERYRELHIEPLFAYLMEVSKEAFNCTTYLDFKALLSFVFMIPYWYTINKWSNSVALTIFFYGPLFLLQIVLVRNFVGFSVLTIAIPLLINPRKNNLILFGMLILIAQGVHNMMFVYLLCYLVIFDFKFFRTPFWYFFICLLTGAFLGGFLFDKLLSMNTSKYDSMADHGTNVLRMVFGFFLVANYYVLRYIYKITSNSLNEQKRAFENLVLKLNLVFIGLTVTFVISTVSIRLFSNLLLFNMIFVANRLYRSTHQRNNFSVYLTCILYVSFWMWYILVVVLSNQLNDVIYSNYFLNSIL